MHNVMSAIQKHFILPDFQTPFITNDLFYLTLMLTFRAVTILFMYVKEMIYIIDSYCCEAAAPETTREMNSHFEFYNVVRIELFKLLNVFV